MENIQIREKLEKLLTAYAHYFDVARDVEVEGGSFPAAADYHFREENYVATRAHTIYASEQHEYVYFYTAEHLDLAALQKEIDLSREAGRKRVIPHGEHMYSYVTLVILADTIDEDAKKALKRYRYRKNFWLTLHGWMEYRIAAMEISSMTFLSNPAGREVRKNLEQNFQSKAK